MSRMFLRFFHTLFKGIFCVLLSDIALVGCVSPSYFQLLVTESADVIEEDGILISYDDLVEVQFDFWGEGGNSGFYFLNKTDDYLYINLKKTHLLVNGTAYVYEMPDLPPGQSLNPEYLSYAVLPIYQAFSQAFGDLSSRSGGGGMRLAEIESRQINETHGRFPGSMVVVPPKSAVVIGGNLVIREMILDPYLRLKPKKYEDQSIAFDKSTSPLKFQSVITYGFFNDLKNDFDEEQIKQEFWVKEVVNYNYRNFVETGLLEIGENKPIYRDTYIHRSPKAFFVTYRSN
ncbi:MAG: hypothetical protein JJU02_08425 [Cryomorphaceae bacterium]|nr:hypothetical protein [Cryomorphaceae bacterium]